MTISTPYLQEIIPSNSSFGDAMAAAFALAHLGQDFTVSANTKLTDFEEQHHSAKTNRQELAWVYQGMEPSALYLAQFNSKSLPLLVETVNDEDAQWASEHVLRAGLFHTVFIELEKCNLIQSRRLSLAAESSQTRLFILRKSSNHKPISQALNACRLRWKIEHCTASLTKKHPDLEWQLTCLRHPQGLHGPWKASWSPQKPFYSKTKSYDASCFSLAPFFQDRTALAS